MSGVTVEDFESAMLELAFQGDWTRTDARASKGSYSYKSASIARDETSETSIDVDADSLTLMSFDYFTSSEGADHLVFKVDDVPLLTEGGVSAAWENVAFMFGPGSHKLKWVYSKDSSGDSGDDAVYIDQIRIESGVPAKIVAGDADYYGVPIPPAMYEVSYQRTKAANLWVDALYGGVGRIAGKVTDNDNRPLHRMVLLLDRRTHLIARSTWSAPDGSYQFDGLDDRPYTVLSHDYSGTYNAVVADNTRPDMQPERH